MFFVGMKSIQIFCLAEIHNKVVKTVIYYTYQSHLHFLQIMDSIFSYK